MANLLIKNAEIGSEHVNILMANGQIHAITPTSAEHEIRSDNLVTIDAKGGAAIPGLHDHHIHLNSAAAAKNSLCIGKGLIEDKETFAQKLHERSSDDHIRVIGYDPSIFGPINSVWLDRHGPDIPIRVQHRGGRLWILNKAAMDALALQDPSDGHFFDMDDRLRIENTLPKLDRIVQELLSLGITGVTEVTPQNGPTEFDHYIHHPTPLKIQVMGNESLFGIAHLRQVALKLHYHESQLPSLDDITKRIKNAHQHNRCVASHCVTHAELMLTLAAFEDAGTRPGDRLEHVAIADDDAIKWIKTLGLTVVTQPYFVHARKKAYLDAIPTEQHSQLWRLNSFYQAGIPCAISSDAPFETYDPWKIMQAATRRPETLNFDEAISANDALRLYTRPGEDASQAARQITKGAPADICLLDRPWAKAKQNLCAVKVITTIIDGHIVFTRNREISNSA